MGCDHRSTGLTYGHALARPDFHTQVRTGSDLRWTYSFIQAEPKGGPSDLNKNDNPSKIGGLEADFSAKAYALVDMR